MPEGTESLFGISLGTRLSMFCVFGIASLFEGGFLLRSLLVFTLAPRAVVGAELATDPVGPLPCVVILVFGVSPICDPGIASDFGKCSTPVGGAISHKMTSQWKHKSHNNDSTRSQARPVPGRIRKSIMMLAGT